MTVTATDPTVFVLGRDEIGTVAEQRETGYPPFRYYLTECCGASAKGLEDYIGCRHCYREVDPMLGGCPDMDVRWSAETGTQFTERPLQLIDVYGDGLPYDTWKSTYLSAQPKEKK